MTSKTKLLKKGKYTPEAVKNSASAPAKKAENKNATTTVASNNYDHTKEAKARSRARRMRSMLKLGMPKELIEEMFAQEDNRMVLVLLYGTYTVEDGTRKVKIHKRDKQHKVCSIETKEVPNILRGFEAAKHYVDENKLHFMSGSRNAIWILTDKDNVDDVVEKLKVLGRVSVTKPEVHNEETKKAPKKPTNNTVEVRKAAKAKRKADNIKKAEMRPYYAALRKGGVSERIKKYNKTLADKIEKWLKEKKAAEASRKKGSEEERAKHRQLTSVEMKGRKRARKAAKFLATQQRRKEAEKKRQEANTKAHEAKVAAAKKKNPVQTEIKMAA